MKKITIVLLLALAGCQTSDQEIRADIAAKAQQDLNFIGLTYTVHNGIVKFDGRCPSEKAFAKIQQTIKNIHVIKDVSYDVVIGPVVLDSLTGEKLVVDSVLAKYPQVIAQVKKDGITLKGVATNAQKANLINDLRTIHADKLKDSVKVQ